MKGRLVEPSAPVVTVVDPDTGVGAELVLVLAAEMGSTATGLTAPQLHAELPLRVNRHWEGRGQTITPRQIIDTQMRTADCDGRW